MPTLFYQVTDTPVNLVGATFQAADLSTDLTATVAVGTTYAAYLLADQNSRVPMKVVEAAAAPDAADQGLPVFGGGEVVIAPIAGEGVYVWSEDATSILIVNEVS